jgi:N-acetylmuramic acid 6-phosphate etherase
MNFIIGIDGGGSKTIGRLIKADPATEINESYLKNDANLFSHETCGSSLSQDFDSSVITLKNLISHLFCLAGEQAQLESKELESKAIMANHSVSITLGLAGAGNKALATRCHNELQQWLPSAIINVLEDCDTAMAGVVGNALAFSGGLESSENNDSVGLISLGTGSFFGKHQNGKNTFVGGWGFPVGDDCSGAAIGFAAVQLFLHLFDNETWHARKQEERPESSDLFSFLSTKIGTDKSTVLDWLKTATQQHYSQLAKPLFELADKGCVDSIQVLQSQAQKLSRYIDLYFSETTDVYITGTVGLALKAYIKKPTPLIESPKPSLDGATFFAFQALESQKSAPNITVSQHLITSENRNTTSVQNTSAIAQLKTEQRRQASMNLDKLSSYEIVSLMNDHNAEIPAVLNQAKKTIALAVDKARDAIANGGRIIYCGAGTSGRLGVLDAVECPPTFSSRPEQVIGLIAGGDSAMYSAVEGAEDDPELGALDLQELNITSQDCIIGIAASGRTPYVIGALEYAQSVNAVTVAVSNNPQAQISQLADVSIVADVGPEVLTGSTRLGAGTAQKMILNMITTGAFVQNGKCFENLMVDVSVTNHKLHKRALNIIKQAAQVDESQADQALAAANQNVKLAILMLKSELHLAQAIEKLRDHDDNLRTALRHLERFTSDNTK